MASSSSSSDCPICSEALIDSEELFTLPCHNCEYNFCTNCVETFVRSSQDDYQEASDGSRQVKIHIACPQCRGKYAMDISKVLLLRKAHSLGRSIVDDDGNRRNDSDLTATQLSLKRDFLSSSKKRQVERAHGLYLQAMDGKMSCDLVENEAVWKRLFEGLPDSTHTTGTSAGDQDDDDDGDSDEENAAANKANNQHSEADDTLFQGLEDCMNKDEKVFLTELLTSGQVSKLHQTAMILHGILKLSTTAQSLLYKLSFQENQKNADLIEKTKTIFPLPNHMPGYFLIPAYNQKQNFLSLEDMKWDGTIIPPQRSKRVFDKVYGEHYHKPSEPRDVVIVKSVRGPAGRVGLRRADVVTHVNDMDWQGTAKELQEHIYQLYARYPNEEFTLTVNANPETATFLQVRYDMMEKSRNQLL
jgi:hypothetical protein